MEDELIVEREEEMSIEGSDNQTTPQLHQSPAPPSPSATTNIKYCHQCRHRASEPVASCKNMSVNKRCAVHFCLKCLLKRYGEDAAEVAQLDVWKCPKCRGICNCSTCMKKRGQKPTGFLEASKHGFSSVSELLLHRPPELLHHGNTVQGRDLSNGTSASIKEAVVDRPCKLGKENTYDGNFHTNLHFQTLNSNGERMNSEKLHSDGLRDISNRNMPDDSLIKIADNGIITEGGGNSNSGEIEKPHGVGEFGPEVVKKGKPKKQKDKEKRHEDEGSKSSRMDEALPEPMIPLPAVTALTTVAGIDIPVEAIGDTLQFLKFCAAFDKLLDFPKGYAKSVIGELLSGRSKRTGRVSLAVQFQLQLLSFIQKDLGEKRSPYPTDGIHSWLKAVGKYVFQSKCVLKEISPEFIDEAVVGYYELDFFRKIKILNFLCDEALNTEYFRSYIDKQNNKFIEMVKETKENLQAARDKEKLLTQKLQDENNNIVTAEGGGPDSVSGQESIASQVKDEISQTQAEIREMTSKLPEKRQVSDVIRTEPVVVDADGRVFWKLKSFTDEPDILLQEIGNRNSVTSDDQWFFFDADKKSAIDGYISSQRCRRKKFRKDIVP